MRRHRYLLAICLAFSAPVAAQTAPEVIISVYRAVPGQQVALLKWLAQQDRAAVAAGVKPGQLYVHYEGASWDYVLIQPATTPAQDKAVDAEAKKMGLATGPASGIEFRKFIAEHTDTIAGGPTTIADFLKTIGE